MSDKPLIHNHKPGSNLPDTQYLRFFGVIALIISVLMCLAGIGNEDKTAMISALIIFLLGIIIIGIGTLINAINCNTEEKRKSF